MQIKAQGLLNAVQYVEETFGAAALGEVVRACSEPVRDRYISAIAIEWHPVSEFLEFVGVADRMLGRGDGQLAEAIGAAGARANLKGALLRIVFSLGNREFLVQRIAGLWRQFNDEGSMELRSFDARGTVIEVRGIRGPHPLFCSVLTGWTREIATAVGAEHARSRHVECRARGDARCLWDVRWSSFDAHGKSDARPPEPTAKPGRSE